MMGEGSEKVPDISGGRLTDAQYDYNFCDMHPPLNGQQAAIEASRCYFCYDAPCIQACPTGINIPSFIKKISTENRKGSAVDILSANIFGGTCARVCPVETLCEKACVRNIDEDKPVAIGQLQRFATDWLFQSQIQPFNRKQSNGKKVAVIGGGPAGLSCAHALALNGYSVTIYEAKPKLGGLNEYGLAPYKVVDNFIQKEIDFILSIGGIEVKTSHALGKNIQLADLQKKYDAVFLGMGLSGVNELQAEGERAKGVYDAVDFISQLRQTENYADLPIGKKVVVVGGGSTAIDVAVESKKLGAEFVTLVYRRSFSEMKATWVEREFAQKSGVTIVEWARPSRIIENKKGAVVAIEFVRTKSEGTKLIDTKEVLELPCDMVFKAIGQKLLVNSIGDVADLVSLKSGKIIVDENMKTNLPNVFAGGDCVNGGKLTVVSVEDGKKAARAIEKMLLTREGK